MPESFDMSETSNLISIFNSCVVVRQDVARPITKLVLSLDLFIRYLFPLVIRSFLLLCWGVL